LVIIVVIAISGSSSGGPTYYGTNVAQAVIDSEVSYTSNQGASVSPLTNPAPECTPDQGTSFDCTLWIDEGNGFDLYIKEGFHVEVGTNSCWTASETSNSTSGGNDAPGATAHTLNGCGLPSH